MDFVIHSSLIGSKKHITSDGEWIDELPDNCWIVGKSQPENDLLTALMLSGCSLDISPPDNHLKVMRMFTYKDHIPWEMVMPVHDYEIWVQNVIDKIYKAFRASDLSYHENIFKRSCEVLRALRPMKIHKKKWAYLAERDIQGINNNVIESFSPNEDGFADCIEYNSTSTISGRLKVVSGPEILLLNKELKQIIKSRYSDGSIIQFDYVSLEPRLALILAGHGVSNDIYSDINSRVFDGKFSRDIVKLSTLSVMYGAGAQSLSEKTDMSMTDSKNIIKQLKEFFGIHDISKRLSKEYKDKKFIRNHFGRAITPESGESHKLYNNFIQSSAVDAAMLGFWNIVKFWDKTDIIPLFVIHDNFGLDFPSYMFTDENIEKTKMIGSEIPKLNGKLLLGHDKI